MRICDWWAGGDERSTKLADWAERLGFHVERTIRNNQQRGVECGYIAAAACEKLIPAISEGAWMHIPLDEHCQSLDVIRRGNRFLFNDDTDRPRFLSGSNVLQLVTTLFLDGSTASALVPHNLSFNFLMHCVR